MGIRVFQAARDSVIKSSVALAMTDYRFALDQLYPLLDRFEEQRKKQNRTFYTRLKKDIVQGCIMPPITLAFSNKGQSNELDTDNIEHFVNNNIRYGYILDGMQRLNTLKDASLEAAFDHSRPLYVNIIIAERYDLLLYRMITLNNGQKPMTARHQIEMLTKGVIDTAKLDVSIVTEKETEGTKIHGAFKKSDVVEAYTAYLTNNVNNQNSKIIESKLDEILVGRVMESNIADISVSFEEILSEVSRFSNVVYSRDWLRQVNNLIGFTVGSRKSFNFIKNIDPEKFWDCISRFELAFESINPSKVNVGKSRRELSAYFVENIEEFSEADVAAIESAFFDRTLSE